MFEAKILQGSLLKKIIEAIRELVVDANLDCNERGITMQVRTLVRTSIQEVVLTFRIFPTGNGLFPRIFVRCCIKS